MLAANPRSSYNDAMADSKALIEEGLGLHRAGQGSAAERLYRQALNLDPDDAEAHHLIGVLRFQEGKPEDAVTAFERALTFDPGNARYLANLGAALLVLGRIDPAVAVLEKAAETVPETPQLLKNLGTAYRQTHRLEEAATACERAVAAFPDDAEAHGSLAAALLSLGRPDEALAAAEEAVALSPHDADMLNTLGSALMACHRLIEATGILERALEAAPDRPEAARNLALVLQDQRRYEESAATYEAIIEKWPEDAHAHAGLGRTRRLQGRLADAVSACRHAVALGPANPGFLSNLLFCLIGSPDQDGQSLKGEHLRWDERFAAAAPRRSFANTRNPDRRLRVGYVSPDFGNHPVGRIVAPVFAARDSAAVEIFCYSNSIGLDAQGQAIADMVDCFVPVSGLSDRDLAARIIADEIDILVDLAGHSARHRLGVFALKPAPVQASWLGYMATTGLSAIDYVIGDPVHTPESFAGHFVEKIWPLKRDLACFAAPGEVPPVGPLPASAAGHVTFGVFNNPGKITDAAVALWSEILKEVPESRLLMRYAGCEDRAVQRHMAARFETHDIDGGALIFEGSTGYQEALAAYGRVDIALDTFPYSGTMTTMEALWMGVPVVALAGGRMTARQAAAHLTAVGLDDFVVGDLDEYRRIAVELAGDVGRMALLRSGMRERLLASELMDATGLARALEAAWRGMWQRWCAAADPVD